MDMRTKEGKKVRKWMRAHREMPHVVPQVDVMKRLKITNRSDFYRLFYKVWKQDNL